MTKKRECKKCQGVMYVVRIAHNESIETCWQCANCRHKKEYKPRMSAKRKEANDKFNEIVKRFGLES